MMKRKRTVFYGKENMMKMAEKLTFIFMITKRKLPIKVNPDMMKTGG